MSGVRYSGSWLPIGSFSTKNYGMWQVVSGVYARVEGEWILIDLAAVAKAPPYNVWEAFADTVLGAGISLSSVGKAYVGYATGRDTATVSILDPSVFTWSVIDVVAVEATLSTRIQKTENLLKTVKVDNAAIVSLNDTFQQLGVDLLASQGGTNTTFNSMVQKLQDTDSFVQTIDQKLGQVIIQGSQVTFDKFNTYQLKVDALNGTLSSISTKVLNTEAGLVTANSGIQQNSDQIALFAGTTSFTDLDTKLTQVSLKLDGVANSAAFESFAGSFKDWGNFQQVLKGGIRDIGLLEKNTDFGFSQLKLSSDITAVKAQASSVETLVASLDNKVSAAITHKEVLTTVDFTSSEIKRELRSETTIANAVLTESLNTYASDQLATASKTTILEATINDPLTGLAKTYSGLTDEITTRSGLTTGLATRTTTLETNLFEADGVTPKFGAAIIDNNIAAIGFCSLNPTLNSSEVLCSLAGGTWHAAEPFASSFKKVMVTDNNGNVVNASNTLTTHIDSLGALEANSVMELDVNGHVSGIRQSNNGIVSNVSFIADTFQVGTLSNNVFVPALYLNNSTNELEYSGVLNAASGTFSGDVSAATGTYTNSTHTTLMNQNGFVIWHGLNANAGAPTKINAVWFLDKGGQYKREISRRRRITNTFSTFFNLTPVPHYIVGGTVELELYLSFYIYVVSSTNNSANLSGSLLVNISFKNGGTTLGGETHIVHFQGTETVKASKTIVDFNITSFADAPMYTKFSSQSFVASVSIAELGTTNLLTSATTKNLYSKFTTLEIA